MGAAAVEPGLEFCQRQLLSKALVQFYLFFVAIISGSER